MIAHTRLRVGRLFVFGSLALLLISARASAQYGGTYVITNRNTGGSLSTGGLDYEQAALRTSIWAASPNQEWTILYSAGDYPQYLTISSSVTFRNVDVLGHLIGGWAPAVQDKPIFFIDSPQGYLFQRWYVLGVPNTGFVIFKNVAMGQCLTDTGQPGGQNAVLVLPCGQGAPANTIPFNQQWSTYNRITGRAFPY